jgi:YbbR domain-containing protein
MKKVNYSVIIFSFLFAFFLWLSINLSNEFQINLSVPLRIENLDSAKALANHVPPSLIVRVRGTGWKLVNTLLTPSLQYTLDVGSVRWRKLFMANNNLSERMNLTEGVKVMEVIPDSILVIIDEKAQKRVPLTAQIDATFREGFGKVGPVVMTPDSVTIVGARSALAMITQWSAQPLTVKELKSAVNATVSVPDPSLTEIAVGPSTAVVHFDVQAIAEKKITNITVSVSQLPSNRQVMLIPPKIDIVIRSGAQYVAGVSDKDITAYVDYRSLLLDTSGTVQPTIVCPENVSVVHRSPEILQYVMRK